MSRKKGLTFFIISIVLITLFSCRKEFVFNSLSLDLKFSADTLYLDTVFTGLNSSTRILKVFNTSDEGLRIGSVALARGDLSWYRLNVNGISGKNVADVEIGPRDSIYIFVEITPLSNSSELLYVDSIVFRSGTSVRYVHLVSLVNDAYFHFPNRFIAQFNLPYSLAPCNTTLPNDKPHVIYGYWVIDSLCTLTIEPGTRLHFHSGSGLWVFNGGTLLIDPQDAGSYENPVILQGDRLEPFYRDIPGQWGGPLGGVFLMGGSKNNLIQNAVIKNGTIGIVLDSLDAPAPNTLIRNTRIFNFSRVGILGGFGSAEIQSSVVANCGLYCFYALGGRYRFTFTTFANYWNQSSRGTPAVALTNFFEDNNRTIQTRDILKAEFSSCIIYGSNNQEVGILKAPPSAGGIINYFFRNSILRVDNDTSRRGFDINNPFFFQECKFNLNPRFTDISLNDYSIDSLSPAIDQAFFNDAIEIPLDIRKRFRSNSGLPDIGAYEYYQ
ncbi:MAG: right-handed parallel beta-helix repeat-containing protein [Thermaurantimonas sp.]